MLSTERKCERKKGKMFVCFVSPGSDESNQIYQADLHLVLPHLNVCYRIFIFMCANKHEEVMFDFTRL